MLRDFTDPAVMCFNLVFRTFCFADIPAQVPPLTPGTNKKMTEALEASFASWEKERLRLNITKGRFPCFYFYLSLSSIALPFNTRFARARVETIRIAFRKFICDRATATVLSHV